MASVGCADLVDSVPEGGGPTTTATTAAVDPTGPSATPGSGGPTTAPTAASTAPTAPPTGATATTPPPKEPPPSTPTTSLPNGNGHGDAPFERADAVAVREGVGVAANGAPLLAATPELLAAQLALAETALHDEAASPSRLDLMAHLQQLVYRRLALHPEWEPAFFAALPAAFHDVARRHLVARRHFVDPDVASVDDLPAWTVVAPTPAEQLLTAYAEAGAAYGVPWQVLAAMNLVESAMGRIQGPSTEGALGPMQFDVAGWAAYGLGGDVWAPRDAIFAAANFLAANGWATNRGEALYRLRGDWAYAAGVEAYAALMAADPAQFGALWRWQVYYANNVGDIWLPEGYTTDVRIPTADYLASHPPANP